MQPDGEKVTADLFAYGSLMFDDIMFTVCGSRYQSAPAVLRDYRRAVVRGQVYPGIVPQRGEVVTGTVYFGLPAAVWQRLDIFEGKLYRRDTVTVELADGRIGEAQTYVVRPEFASRLGRKPWSAEEFLQTGKRQFEARYLGFKKLTPPDGDR